MHVHLLLIFTFICYATAWNDDDLEVFDVVEEVNQNFYELMGVSQDATPQEIKSAFKKLTLKLHPDKNSAQDADIQFRNLVSVHNILKDPAKREIYNEVLKNGLPNWRSAVYYYRHVRKMGLAEGSIILFIIITFGQYAVGWAAYAEKRYTAEQILNSKVKRIRKSGFESGLAEILDQLPKPSIKDTLPFQIPRLIWRIVTGVPLAIIAFIEEMKEMRERSRLRKKKEEEEKAREASASEALKGASGGAGTGGGAGSGGARRRRGFVPTERARDRDCLLDAGEAPEEKRAQPAYRPTPVVSGGLWTDDDLAELVRLVKKYPGGTSERWERIAETMGRAVPEVTHMAAKLKDNCYKVPGQEANELPAPEPPKKVKTRKNEEAGGGGGGGVWSQSQQKALEGALARYPKGGAADRWEKIANSVPGKTKEECMLRCKYLSDLVKKQKQDQEEKQKEAEERHMNGVDQVLDDKVTHSESNE